jgi:hypothetical protein
MLHHSKHNLSCRKSIINNVSAIYLPVASLTIDVHFRSCVLVDCKDIKLVMKHRVTSHNQRLTSLFSFLGNLYMIKAAILFVLMSSCFTIRYLKSRIRKNFERGLNTYSNDICEIISITNPILRIFFDMYFKSRKF